MPELLKMLKEYTTRVCGSIIMKDVIKVTQFFDIGDMNGLKSGLAKAANRLEKLVKELRRYSKLMDKIRSYEVQDCSIDLEMQER